MAPAPDFPLPYRIIALMQERNRLFEYPLKEIESAIRAYGFRCTQCGRCCTRSVNDHIFLLDRDAARAREIDPESLEPAPDPEFCDQNGILYVSGFALKMRGDADGSCWFLKDKRCRIYDRRFSVCRIYPHMLRRHSGAGRQVTWQHLSGQARHGSRNQVIPDDECRVLAGEIREYENAFLTQQISFLENIHEYFTVHGLRHDREMLYRQVRRSAQGKPVTVNVYCSGELEECVVTRAGPSRTARSPQAVPSSRGISAGYWMRETGGTGPVSSGTGRRDT